LIASAVPTRERHKHPATRSFQAIRIFINHELVELQEVLANSLAVLSAYGRLVVISFHSLEDRIVKRFIRRHSEGESHPRGLPITDDNEVAVLRKVGRAIRPSLEERQRNPRARSAVLRIAERVP
jgi:16S rRNA (cytosine1402-N4)-methyltransferase